MTDSELSNVVQATSPPEPKWGQFLEPKFVITLLILLPAWVTVWFWWQSQPHLVLGTNLITGVMGYWIGSSKGSDDKTQLLAESPPIGEGGCRYPKAKVAE